MTLCMACSAVARILVFSGLKGSGEDLNVWSQILLPITATLLYVLIVMISGKELFYKTAIPVWMIALYSGLWISDNVEGKMMVWLFWIALIFFSVAYTQIVSGAFKYAIWLLLPVVLSPERLFCIFTGNPLWPVTLPVCIPRFPTC